MGCKHCGALRRGEGGLKIGGRALATLVPGCPCAGLPRVVYGEDQSKWPLETTIVYDYFYNYAMNWRFCSVAPSLVRFEITSVECLNVDSPALFISAAANICFGSPDGCSRLGAFDPIGQSGWNNAGFPTVTTPFETGLTGEFYVIEISVAVVDDVPFIEVPLLRINYNCNPET